MTSGKRTFNEFSQARLHPQRYVGYILEKPQEPALIKKQAQLEPQSSKKTVTLQPEASLSFDVADCYNFDLDPSTPYEYGQPPLPESLCDLTQQLSDLNLRQEGFRMEHEAQAIPEKESQAQTGSEKPKPSTVMSVEEDFQQRPRWARKNDQPSD